MADTAVEKNDAALAAEAEEVDAKKEETPAAENGAAETGAANGASEVAAAEAKSDASAAAEVAADAKKAAPEENGDEQNAANEANEPNDDSTDSAPAEAVKRKVVEGEAKTEESAPTPEKKAKLDEATKEDVQNGSEASEVAA